MIQKRKKILTAAKIILRFWNDCSPQEKGLLILVTAAALWVAPLYDYEVDWIFHWIFG